MATFFTKETNENVENFNNGLCIFTGAWLPEDKAQIINNFATKYNEFLDLINVYKLPRNTKVFFYCQFDAEKNQGIQYQLLLGNLKVVQAGGLRCIHHLEESAFPFNEFLESVTGALDSIANPTSNAFP